MFNFNFFSYTKEFVVQSRDAKLIMSSTTSIKKVQTSSSLTSALIKLIWGTLILVGEQRGLVIFMTRLMSWKRSCFSQRWKKKNFSNKNTSLHEKKMNSRSSVRLLNIDGRTASFTTDIIWQNAWVWKKKSTIIGCRNYETWY